MDDVSIAAAAVWIALADTDFGRVEYVVTHPDQRGRGHGRRLVAAAAAAIASAGKSDIFLSLDVGNAAARRLYRSQRFVETIESVTYEIVL